MKEWLIGLMCVVGCVQSAASTGPTWCFYQQADMEAEWAPYLGSEPIDTAFARDALANLKEYQTGQNWEQHELETPESILKPRQGTTTYSDGSTTSYRRTVVKRPDGYWSRASEGYPWVYDISLYRTESVQTKCTPSGGCTTESYSGDWAECISREFVPYRIAIETSRLQVKPSLEPVKFKFTVTHGGLPVREKEVPLYELLKHWGSHGSFEAVPTPGRPWGGYTNKQGQIELAFRPKALKPVTIPMSFTCEHCENSVDAWVVMQQEVVIGFFNGVANTDEAAQDSLKRLEVEFGPKHEDSPLKYAQFYNQTACGAGALGKLSCLEDVAEVFEQRSRELGGVFTNRWESFWDILAGRHQQDTSFTGRLIGLLGDGGKALLMWVDGAASAMLNQLTSGFLKLLTLFIDSPTYENQADHLGRLTRYADEGSGLLLVAHSQGNLFVNSAVDALKAVNPDAQVQVVHVAPASPTLRGDYVLADIDLVINGLRLTGLNSVPDININLPLSKIDPTGHSFEPTYLDKARAAYSRTIGTITTSLAALTQ
ncbi:hypothetical protein [Hydrogenophaga sp.]|uniref:hypothetical protein n=1 Tax=Hydrogenophaga sp. TaxID=1904254 RepID=UPI002FC7D2A7